MSFPVIKVDSTNVAASDTAASGAGPGTALSGATNAATDATGLVVTLPAGTDLSGVATDGSAALFLNDATAGARNFGSIVGSAGSGGATPTVTIATGQVFGLNLTGKSWAIGGTRATVGGTNSAKLFANNGAAGDAMPGWAVEMQSGHAETIAATFALRRAGDLVGGPITLRGALGAATVPVLTFSNNGAMIQQSAANQELKDFELKNSNVTKTASIGITANIACRFARIAIRDAANAMHNGISAGVTGVEIDSCEISNCTSHGVLLTTSVRTIGNYIHNNGGDGINVTGANSGSLIEGNLIAGNAGNGIQDARTGTTSGGGSMIRQNTLHGNTGAGLLVTANGTTATTPFLGMHVENNSFTGNGTFGINFSGAPVQAALDGGVCVIRNNNFGSGATANGGADANACSLASAIAPTSNIKVDPGYANAAGGNYAVGVNAQNVGYPTANVGNGGSATRSYVAIGVAQAQPGAGYTAAANVRSGTNRGDGTLGTLVVPVAANVLTGTTFDNGTLGTATVPTAAQTLVGIAYGAGGNAITGTVTLPAVADVQAGVTFGPSLGSAGTFAWPVVGDVRSGIGYGAGGTEFTGTLVVSGATYTDPGIANVKIGVAYTYNSAALTGTYDGSDRWTDPGITHVQAGTAYKANSAAANRTGTYDPVTGNYTDPGLGLVAVGTSYKFAGATIVGTYDGSDRWSDPGVARVQAGTAYRANSTANNRTGTYDPVTGNYADPGLANVKVGTAYAFAGSILTGTYDGSDRWTDPGITHVQAGTAYKANSTANNRTGTYDPIAGNYTDPGVGNVAAGTTYEFGGSLMTGTYSAGAGSGMTVSQLRTELDARGLTPGFTADPIADGSLTSAKFAVASYAGPASGALERADQVWRYLFKKVDRNVSGANIRTFADDGTTVATTQPIANDGKGVETRGNAT